MVIDTSIIQIALIIIVLYFLYSWSQLETKRYKIFLYFIVSTIIVPLFVTETRENRLELWFPLGFTYLFVYLMLKEDKQPNKVKACILGLVVGVYMLISKYWGVY
ncbi:MAG: hypothetical protein K0S51_1121 [Bacillales bacterium]|nr:hypothetical protein [Bacillales bacterium]